MYIYLTRWNEQIRGERVGAGPHESDFSIHLSHWFSRILSCLLSSRCIGRRARRVISAVVATPRNRAFHDVRRISRCVYFQNAHIGISIYSISRSLSNLQNSLSSYRGPATKYHRKLDIWSVPLFFSFLFFFFVLNIINFLKSLSLISFPFLLLSVLTLRR